MVDRCKCPELGKFENLSFDYPSYVTLSNGVKLYVLNYGDQEVNRLEIIYRGGLMEEDKPLQAMALASMLVHGSDKYTSEEVSELLDYNGAYMNATSHDNFTHVSLNSLNKNFENLLPVIKSILDSPSIPIQEFALFKSQVKSAYRNARERVKYLSQMAARGLYFGTNHPLAHMISDNDVDNLSAEDVKAFHSHYYRPENSVMILSGKIGDSELSVVDKYFGQDKCGDSKTQLNLWYPEPSTPGVTIVNKEGALQSSVYMIHEAVPRSHQDYIKLRILITALGGYFGSRLMQNIREDKGYTYGISSMLVGRRIGAKVVISSECDTIYTYSLIEEVKNEIKKLQEELISEEELQMVKNCMLSDLAKTLDSPFTMASCVSSNIQFSTGEDYFNKQVSEINEITPQILKNVANKYLNIDNFHIAIAGNEKELK